MAVLAAQPPARLAVCAVVVAESAALVGYGVYLAVATVVGHADWTLASSFLAVTFLVLGAGLSLVTAGVLRSRVWARSPVVTWQLLQAAVALTVFSHQAAPLIVLLGSAVLGLLVVRSDVLPPDDRGV